MKSIHVLSLTIFSLLLVAMGCGGGAGAPESPTKATISGPPVYGEIELSEPKAIFEEPDIIQVEIPYRFTKGGPTNHYSVEVSFPGTDNFGVKPMSGWELEESGVIRDGFVMQSLPVREIEVRITEALLPQDGYTLVSNVVTGEVDMTGYTAEEGTNEEAEVEE
jgi:hypothetical protein